MDSDRNIYVCPESKARLRTIAESTAGSIVISGRLICDCGHEYPIRDGIPDITYPRNLQGEQKVVLEYYEGVASVYDEVSQLTFRIQFLDEVSERKRFVQLLDLKPGYRVLEIACGTGKDTLNIASELDETGQLYALDISSSMLSRCRDKLSKVRVPVELSVGNGCSLAFPEAYFDAVFSFGGIGVFGDIRKSLKEIVRVCKPGAKVVVGDESMPPWLYETEYGQILMNTNPLLRNQVPLGLLPVETRNVAVRWVLGGIYYLIEFNVGEGEPKGDFNIEIPGKRGGTLRTRFYGRLEGVDPITHDLAQRAREKSGKSMHDWLDGVVREAAKKDLGMS